MLSTVGSQSKLQPATIALVVSIVEPPPTASKASTFSYLTKATPSATLWISGFGLTLPNSTNYIPYSLSFVIILSSKPYFLADSLPWTSKTFFTLSYFM